MNNQYWGPNNNPNQGYGQVPGNYNPYNGQGYYNQPQSGMVIGQPNRQVVYPGQPNVSSPQPKKSKKKWIIMGIIFLLVIVMVVVGILLFTNKGNSQKKEKKHRDVSMNRTILIYMVGSDLETSGSASLELNHIRPNNIDLENNNILLIAGGSKKWNNDFIVPEETSIYQLKESGFEKVKQDDFKNMGEASTLTDFLTMAYNEYPSKKYELIFWNHGIGISGVAYDDLSEDALTFSELKTALENSPFKEEKLETVLFMNSLLGNIELASVLDDYANYMVASEELVYIHSFIDKFKFLEELETEDDGVAFGKKYIENLSNNNYLNSSSKYYHTPITYSIIDLSKIGKVEQDLESFAKKVSSKNDMEGLARARSKTVEYGGEDVSFDMVDLSNFVSNLESLAPTESKNLIDSIASAVVYNYSTDKVSKGLSVYFPYHEKEIEKQIEGLEELPNKDNYISLIQSFDDYRKGKKLVELRSKTIETFLGSYRMELSEEEKNKIVESSYVIFKESSNGNFLPIYFSPNTSYENGKLIARFDGKVLAALDTTTNTMIPMLAYEQDNGKYMTKIQLQKMDKSDIVDANAYIEFQNDTGKLGFAIKKNKDYLKIPLPMTSILTLENYQTLLFKNSDYKILGNDGEIVTEWKSDKEYTINALVNHYRIQKVDIDKTEKYYFAFKVTDLWDNTSYSKLVEIK